MTTAPIIKTLTLNAPCEKAFHHFTDNMHVWWPLESHSLTREDAVYVTFEAHEGGRIYETDKAGATREWGSVIACEPPHRLVFSWVLEAPDKATEIEVTFEPMGDGACTCKLTHRGWENRADGAEARENYLTGWDGVLRGYVEGL